MADIFTGTLRMRYDLQYGVGFLHIEVNDRIKTELVKPPTIVDLPSNNIIMNSLEHPEDSQPLSKLVTNAQSVTIVVTSHDDNETAAALLQTLLSSLSSKISDTEGVSLIYPSTFDSLNHESETLEKIQKAEDEGCALIPHNPNSSEILEFVGVTPTNSTPVHVNKAFVKSELKIGVGTISPSVLTGATGGRMAVIPGCAGSKSIERNSKLQAISPLRPYTINNEICLDLEEASRLAGLDFILNAVSDCDGHIAHIAAGDPYTSWKNSIKTMHDFSEASIRYKADITVVSAGGSRYDRTFFDALDALYPACQSTEQGGVIVLVAECPDGVGPKGFLKGVSECTTESDVAMLSQTRYEYGMEKARLLWNVLSSRKVILCSKLREPLVSERLHCFAVHDPQEGLALARDLIVSKPRMAIIPQGMKTIPVQNS